ncbi:MAG: carbohydrate binding domain-containing protein [Prolixibacteraceae bacterium]|nr:carbohydrate binding domain-containing protein [Prolixibacteraceae bacterium]
MKKIFLFLLIANVAFIVQAQTNGDFETDTIGTIYSKSNSPTGWFVNHNDPAAVFNMILDEDERTGGEGSKSFKCTITSSSKTLGIRNNISSSAQEVEADISFKVSFWAKGSAGGEQIKLKLLEVGKTEGLKVETFTLSKTWTKYEMVYYPTKKAFLGVLFMFNQAANFGGHSVWIDDVIFHYQPPTVTDTEVKTWYVSTFGSNSNEGTLEAPFKTIQYAVSQINGADKIIVREGHYHEVITVDKVASEKYAPAEISNYNNEKVVLDGTIAIDGTWEKYKKNIYRMKSPEPVWQLFVDDKMQVPARWPNGNTHPCDPLQRKPNSYFEAEDGTWWSKKTTWANADAPGTSIENSTVENNPEYFDLAALNMSFVGGRVIYAFFAQGGDGNQESEIIAHQTGSNSFLHSGYKGPGEKKGYQNHDKFYIIEDLKVLDQKNEWFYTPEDSMIYLWVEDEDIESLADRKIRGRTITRCLYINASTANFKVKGIDFFAGNFKAEGDGFTIEDCRILYPDASQRMLKKYAATSGDAVNDYGTLITGTNFTMRNCEYAFSEMGIKAEPGYASMLDNCLLHHISMWGMGHNSAIQQFNTVTRTTYHTGGPRGGFKTNTDPVSGRWQSYNLIRKYGYMQVDDGSGLQVAPQAQQGTVRSYNWFFSSYKYGSRWDGEPGGTGATIHHTVGRKMRTVIMVKGDEMQTYNNTCFDGHPSKNDIVVISDPGFGGNANSFTLNNFVDKMSGHRSDFLSNYPIPGTHSHNWNGYEQDGKTVKDFLVDPDNYDFRPSPMLPLLMQELKFRELRMASSEMLRILELTNTAIRYIGFRATKPQKQVLPFHPTVLQMFLLTAILCFYMATKAIRPIFILEKHVPKLQMRNRGQALTLEENTLAILLQI